MNHRPMLDMESAISSLFVVLYHHLNRRPTAADYELVEARVMDNVVRLVVEVVSDRTRFHVDIDADAVPAVRQALGIVAH